LRQYRASGSQELVDHPGAVVRVAITIDDFRGKTLLMQAS
jgi:hypothetical protein